MTRFGMRGRWVAGFAWVVLGCGGDRGTSNDGVTTERSALTTVTFTLPLFVGENPTDVGLAASSSLSVNDRAFVEELASGRVDEPIISNVGTADLSTVVGASSGVGTVLSGGQVFLRIHAIVDGSVYQGGTTAGPATQGSFTVTGITKPHIGFATDTTWTRTVTWPTTVGTPPNLDPNGLPPNVRLAPNAAYPNLDVKTGRTLIFDPGEYFLDGLTVEPGAFLDIEASNGPVFIYIRDGGLIFRGGFAPGRNTVGMPVPSLTVMTTGSVDIEQPFTGVVIAPNGSLDLKANVNTNAPKTHRGAFFARTVTLFEGNLALHYRDPYSFRGFGGALIGDRASVTGGTIRLVSSDVTDEAHQSESVTAITRVPNQNGSTFVVTVGYNDFTVSRTNPTLVYSNPPTPGGDPRDGTGRLIKKGTTLMGWSYSVDDGRTFTYGGRVAPPSGWPLIWGDPAIAKAQIDDPFVYYAQIAGTTAAFESVWDSTKQGIVSNGANIKNALDGHCVSRSVDRGITFNSVACVQTGFSDGSALAVAVDQAGHRQVYVAGTKNQISRMDGDTMTFSTTAIDPPLVFPPNQFGDDHPRMRVFNGVLYYVRELDTNGQGTNLLVNRLNAATNATTWLGQTTVMCGMTPCQLDGQGNTNLGNGATLAVGPGFSFDIGPDASGQNKLRIMIAVSDGTSNGIPTRSLKVLECNLDATNCRTTGWSTVGDAGEELAPGLRFGGGFVGAQWVATWRKTDPASPLNTIRQVAGNLAVVGGVETLQQKTLYPAGVPCFFGIPPNDEVRLGEYDYPDAFGDGRYFAPYSTSGPGCRWHGTWTSDAHIGGSTFAF